jgi:hypothetical protein
MGLITFMDVTWDTDDPEQVKKVRALKLSNEYATFVDLERKENGDGKEDGRAKAPGTSSEG